MEKPLPTALISCLLLLCIVLLPLSTQAQTTGLIYKIATNGGNKILDPNGDGYVSKSSAGFQLVNGIRLDEGADYSEIPYRPFPVFMDEPLADLKTGGSYGHTDYAPKVYDANGKPVGSPLASYYDGKNFLFRVRLAGQSTASKGYSILIDINSTLTGGAPNPGFEFEVVLATNFDVRVYDHRTNTTGGDIIFNGSVDQYSQKAIAGSTGGGDADYFYDFYVPMSVFGNAITPTTPLRMTGVTVTSAKSGIFGVASDLGGVDDNVVSGTVADIWKEVINSTPTSTPTTIKDTGFTPVTASAPKVNSPIYSYSTSISGTSIEAEGSVVTVYRNGVSIGTTTVLSNGSWVLQNLSPTLLQATDLIKATVKPTSETISAFSTEVSVIEGTCYSTPPKVTGAVSGGKGIIFTVYQTGEQTIKIYSNGSQVFSAVINIATAPASYTYNCSTGQCFNEGNYSVTSTLTGQCESAKSNTICYQKNAEVVNYVPTITTTSLSTTPASISGTFPVSGTVTLVINGSQIAGRSATLTGSNTNWTINLSGLTFVAGDRIWVVATTTSNCSSTETSNVLIVSGQTSAPTITGTYCGTTTTITGTSSEAAGTIIRVYNGATQIGTTTVNSFGSWTATITSQSSGTLTATASAPNKSVSAASTGVSINAVPTNTGLSITGTSTGTTIYEGSASVIGNATGITNGSVVTLYINGQAYVNGNGDKIYATVTSGAFTFSNISPFELYAGAKLTVTVKATTSSACESAQSAAVTVACNPALTTMVASFTAAKFCPGTPAYIRLSTSEAGVIYNIYKKNTDNSYSQFGPSILGTGSTITLQSDPVTTVGTILQVKTIKVGAPCQYVIGGDMTVSLYDPVPKNFSVTATPDMSACANLQSTITVQNAETGYSYQLIINNATKDKVGPAIVPTVAGNISFPPVTVSQTTVYGVVITGTTSGCVAENTILKTITITGGPDVNRAVTANQTTICMGTSATINVATENSYSYRIYQEGNATPLASFTGNGATIGTGLSSPFTTTGVKNFYVTVSNGTCNDLRMTQTVSITVTNGTGGTVSAGPNATSCGSTYTLAGRNPTPGTGIWSLISKPAAALNPTITTPSAYNSTVTGLMSGNYTFRWTVASACNGAQSFAEVTITVNCPAEYSTTTNKVISEYVNNEVLATVTDPEGIKSVSLVAGRGSLPLGTSLNTSTGVMSVSNASSLQPGTYPFTLRVTDLFDKVTDIPLSMRFYSASLRPTDPVPLPVELVYFTAVTGTNGTVLQWKTASEQDNDRFEIERSQDGKVFTKIGTVAGNGTTNKSILYSYTDTKPLADISYYRLKQIDFDGTFKHSKIISVKNKMLTGNSVVQAYPNPFSDKLTVTVTSSQAEQAILTIYNLQGKELHRQELSLERGINNHTMDTRILASGVYVLKITGNSIEVTTKVLKK
ncbi:T9SS type A sorting domain-containing protein [Pontibacter sp. H259]|uniref:T9SS type A sorting domain-containing protein n=1 Tax=Pontibacter sp. H259 TaxID=3133421 RepID=UPI0030BC007A